ncbi:hypothetical protein KA005_81370 [bacterium]|nr:hypothetical protein [bacterium]
MGYLQSVPKGVNKETIPDIAFLGLMAVAGELENYSVVHKFGAGAVTATLAPVSTLNKYETPTAAVSLEVVSDDANDTSGGTGARKVTVVGLNAAWEEVSQAVTMNGLTPVALATPLIRMYRWYVSESGTYASATAGSHAGNLTIQVSGAGASWDQIVNTPLATGQSQIGAYTIPAGKIGYLLGKLIFTDTSKVADVYMYKREKADDVVAPYTGIMRITEREVGIQGGFDHHFKLPKAGFVGPCDLGFMAKVPSGTAEMSVEFELLIVDA